LLPFIVIGVTTGAVYGLAGTGLVLTYKTSGIFNFAYGSIAALAVFSFYFLHTEHNWPWPLAAFLILCVMSPLLGLLLELFARSLENVSATLKVVATVGLLLLVLGVGTLWYGDNLNSFPPFLSTTTVRFLGVNIQWQQIILLIVSVIATGILYYFFRFVRMGVAMRGVVDNPDLLAMVGFSPIRVRRWAWIIGTVFASLSGLLLAPSLSLDALTITLLVVQAFGAAAIGYFTNLPLTFLGGIAIGIGAAVSTKFVGSINWLSGLPASLPFIVLFIVLIVTPRSRLIDRRVVTTLAVHKPWEAPPRVRAVGFGAVVLFLCFVPEFAGVRLSIWSNFLVAAILFLSVGLLVRTAGQISLCQYAFAAIGAAAFSHFTGSYHIPWLAAILLASILAIPVGALIAIPAIRLSGVFLALATLGFGIFLAQMMYTTNLMFGPLEDGIPAPRPNVSLWGWHLGSDTGFYYVLLICAVLAVALILAIQRGRMGRLLRGLSDSPVALETHGAATNVIRVLIFSISAGLAAFAGALTASFFRFSVGGNYASFQSLTLVAIIVISVGGAPWYGILAALGFVAIPGYVTVSNINTYLEMLFGIGAATFALASRRPTTVPLPLRNFLDKIGGRRPEAKNVQREVQIAVDAAISDERSAAKMAAQIAAPESQSEVSAPSSPRSGIVVENLAVHFGGVRAVQDLSLEAPLGRITGLIGPNGAGKTTTFNACSGLVKPTKGDIYFHDTKVTSTPPYGRARMGLGRTFQRAELFNSLSVRDNIQLGREASLAGANPLTQLFSTRSSRSTVASAVDQSLELTGTTSLAEVQAGLLPTGQRRLVELARALAGPFDMLLLDEPSAGLDASETERFGEILTRVVREWGIGILLVEHDMALVQQVCQRIYVMDFGRQIFEGTPTEMLTSSEVRSAYLGEEQA
jgi:ABC-type branched-subunit amino acid transport system ATPase component/branched-subunit amino acid ABC-type transport system permease component